MSVFLRHQLSPYCVAVERTHTFPNGVQWVDEALEPAMHVEGPVPHGRSGDGQWGPDQYGYTDFDDYHLTIYGA